MFLSTAVQFQKWENEYTKMCCANILGIKSCIQWHLKVQESVLFSARLLSCVSSDTERVHTTESANWPNYCMFESLRELIYSEVASLISQNEMQPQYLLELFQRLQLLTTDDQRQRVIATIEQVVADYVTDSDEQPTDTLRHQAGLQRSVSIQFTVSLLVSWLI